MKFIIPEPQRPSMQNYGIVTSNDGILDWSWVRQEITKARNYWICTTRPDGRPHGVPVWGIVLDDVVYFGSGKSAVKSRNLAQNPRITLHLESGDDCVIIEGMVFSLKDRALLERMATAYGKKYPSFQPKPEELVSETGVVYGVQPYVVLAWKESDFPNTATRWVFEEYD